MGWPGQNGRREATTLNLSGSTHFSGEIWLDPLFRWNNPPRKFRLKIYVWDEMLFWQNIPNTVFIINKCSFCGFFSTFVCFLFNSRDFLLHCKGKRCYRDPSSGDFTLNPESPAWLLGITQVIRDWANILLNWINLMNDCFQKEKFPGGHREHWSKKAERHWSTLLKPEMGTSHMSWLRVQ